jgi:hypothetical protein
MSNLIGQTIHREKLSTLFAPTDRAVVVLDSSGSRASGEIWSEVNRDAATITRDLESRGVNVGVVEFSCDARPLKNVDGSSAAGALRYAYEHPIAEGSDGMAEAIHMASSMLGGPGGLVLVFTDGVMDGGAVKREVCRLEEEGTQVIGVGRQGDDRGDLAGAFRDYYLTSG